MSDPNVPFFAKSSTRFRRVLACASRPLWQLRVHRPRDCSARFFQTEEAEVFLAASHHVVCHRIIVQLIDIVGVTFVNADSHLLERLVFSPLIDCVMERLLS